MTILQIVALALKEATAVSSLSLEKTRVVVGVSGGPDSLALLHLLIQRVPPEQFVVAHLDHRLRSSSADDAREVSQTAARWGLDFVGEQADVRTLAHDLGLSLEEAGRKARYDFLARVATETEARIVAVGHHADDQAETILMHLLRGSGLSGLRGMALASPLPDHPTIWLWRPLLEVDRKAIEAYCQEWDLQPLIDETNEDQTFFRNRLRHELLPMLKTYNPKIGQHLRHMGMVVTADFEVLTKLTDEVWEQAVVNSGPGWVQLNQPVWRSQMLSTRRALLRRGVAHCAPQQRDIGFVTIEAAREIAEAAVRGSQATLPGGTVLTITYDTIDFVASKTQIPLPFPQLLSSEPIVLTVPGRVSLADGWTITAEEVAADDLEDVTGNKDRWTAYLSLDRAVELLIRPRLPGERFQPLGLDGHYAKVGEVMINRKLPAPARDRWPLVATKDHLVWIPGHVIDHRSRVQEDSNYVVRLRCEQS